MCIKTDREIVKEGQKFWMVQGGQGPASRKHSNKADADREAARLAEKHPGHVFYVMGAICGYRTDPPVAKLVQLEHPSWGKKPAQEEEMPH